MWPSGRDGVWWLQTSFYFANKRNLEVEADLVVSECTYDTV